MAEKPEPKPSDSQPVSSSPTPTSSKPTTRAALLSWRISRLKEILLVRSKSDDRGKPQRKVRWGRAESKRKSRSKRVKRDRRKAMITKQLRLSRLHKGQNARSGGR